MSDTDGFFITRAEIEMLGDKLDLVGDLVAEMAIALTGFARMANQQSISRPRPKSREPYSLHIEQLLDELNNELSTTVRHVLEHREGLDYTGGTGTAGMAKWLYQKRFAIGMIEDAPETFYAICKLVDRCARCMNTHEPERVINQDMVAAANRQVLTATMIEKLAYKLGDDGKGLTKNRVENLRRKHKLPHTRDEQTGTYFYKLGDVLAHHKAAKSYNVKKSA